jgi:cell division protein FtsW
VIVIARYFARFPEGLHNWRRALPPFVFVGATALLIAVEPDMGTAAVFVLAMFVLLHIAGTRLRHLLGAATLGMAFCVLMVCRHPYQLRRLASFLFREETALDGGYQATHALIAMGSGGLAGRGLGGSVEKYFYLPAAITDSILAVIGEELGMIATWSVVALFAWLVFRGLAIASSAPDRFSGLVAAGVACLLGTQALVNVAAVTAMVPTTGVPLPFVSYGGSSLLISLIGVGLLLNVSGRARSARLERDGL